MGTIRLVGGILAAVGAGLVILQYIYLMLLVGFDIGFILRMIVPAIALVGGLLAIAGKRAGGIIALIVGLMWFTLALILNLELISSFEWWVVYFTQFQNSSIFGFHLDFMVWGYLTVETTLVLVGGILATAGGSD